MKEGYTVPLNFEQLSFNNTVRFFADKLKLLNEGNGTKVFTIWERKKLRRDGIIQLNHYPPGYIVTEKAKKVLNE